MTEEDEGSHGSRAMADPRYENPRYAAAVEEQNRLRALRREKPLPEGIRLVGGADVSFFLYGKTFWGGIVVCDIESGFAIVESAVVRMEVDFPYLPGLLGFREVPVLNAAFRRLKTKPEVTLLDGHGLSHPRRFGSAAHFGVLLGVPTVGCAKSRLCGEYEEPAYAKGAWSPLLLEGDTVGAVLRSRARVSPIYVSAGHLSDLPTAVGLVMRCCPRYRIPEPIRRAHELVNVARSKRQQNLTADERS